MVTVAVNNHGMDINRQKNRRQYYYLQKRTFHGNEEIVRHHKNG